MAKKRKKRRLSLATRRKISRALYQPAPLIGKVFIKLLKGKKRGPRKGTPRRVYERARKARLAYKRAAKTTKPFQKGGKRFKAIEASAKARGARNPAAVAAAAGIKKYGKKRFLAGARKARVRKSAHPGRGYISAKRRKKRK